MARFLTNGEIKGRRKRSAISALAGAYVFVINMTFFLLAVIMINHTENSKLKFMEVKSENGLIYNMVAKQFEFAVTQMVEVFLSSPAWATFKTSLCSIWQPISYLWRQPFSHRRGQN